MFELIFLMFIILVAILFLMVVILKKLQTIKKYIIGDSLFIDSEFKKLSKLHEILPELEPMLYLPRELKYPANTLTYWRSSLSRQGDKTYKELQKNTLREMEKFAKSGSSSKAFPASNRLKETLREYVTVIHDGEIVDKLTKQYEHVLLDVMTGKVTIEQVEELVKMPVQYWRIRDEVSINKLFDKEAEKWQAGKWFELFEELKAKREEEIEMNKPWE